MVLDIEGTVSNLAEGSLNVLSGLLLFTLVFICIFPAWLMGPCDFSLSCSGFVRDRFFSLSLTVFGGLIGDLCNSCFVGDFALLGGVVHVRVVDPMRVFAWTTSLDFSLFVTCR